MTLIIRRANLVELRVDAIVNAANEQLWQGSGVCGAIFAAAGAAKLRAACERIGGCPTGEAVLTPGFRLPARYVIHTAGPVWHGGGQGEAALLASCYRNALALAVAQGLHSIAFPLLSAGLYGYPKADALHVAVETIRAAGGDAPGLAVTLALLDPEALALASAAYPDLCASQTTVEKPQKGKDAVE